MENLKYSPVMRQNRLPFQVSDQIESLILSKHLKPGERLPTERELSVKFNVSRTVIREAIRILEARRLVTTQGGSGTYVKDIQTRDIAHSLGIYITIKGRSVSHLQLMELRQIIEVQIAERAAERADAAALNELETHIAHMEAAVCDPAAFARSDLAFHLTLARATGNDLLVMLLDPLMDVLFEARRMASELPGVPEEAIQMHKNILRRVKAHDPKGAARAMARHLAQAERVTIEGLQAHSDITG